MPVSVDNLETTIPRWDHVGFAREKIAPEWEGFIVSEISDYRTDLVITTCLNHP